MTEPNGLSPRETQVIRLMAQGMTRWQIALTLDITPNTARNHARAIHKKLRTADDENDNHKKHIRAVMAAFRNGTADLEESYRAMRIRQRSRRAIQLMKARRNP